MEKINGNSPREINELKEQLKILKMENARLKEEHAGSINLNSIPEINSVVSELYSAFSQDEILKVLFGAIRKAGFDYYTLFEYQDDKFNWQIETSGFPEWFVDSGLKLLEKLFPIKKFNVWFNHNSDNIISEAFNEKQPHTVSSAGDIVYQLNIEDVGYNDLPEFVQKNIFGLIDKLGIQDYTFFPLLNCGVIFAGAAHRKMTDDSKSFLWLIVELAGKMLESINMNKQLRDNERKYELLIQNAPASVNITNRDSQVTGVSDKWLLQFGYSRDEVIGRSLVEFLFEDSKKYYQQNIHKELNKNGRCRDIPLKFIKHGGEITNILFSSFVMTDDSGSFAGTVDILSDVSKRRKKDHALNDNYKNLNEILSILPLKVFAAGMDGSVLYANGPFIEGMGLKRSKVVGKNLKEFDLSGKNGDGLSTLIKKFPKNSGKELITEKITGIDGNQKTYLIGKIPSGYDGDDAILVMEPDPGALPILQSLDNRTEEMYRQLVEGAGIAILIDNIDGEIVYYNEKFIEFFGHCISEDKKVRIESIVHNSDLPKVLKYHNNRFLNKDVPARYVFRGKSEEKTKIFYEVDSVALVTEGKITGTRSYIWDITKRKQAENISNALLNIAGSYQQTTGLKELFGIIHNSLKEIIDANNFFIALFNKNNNTISFPYFVDEKDEEFTIVNATDSGSLTARVISTGKPLLMGRHELIEWYAKEEKEKWGTLPLMWLGIPLKVKGQVIGAVGVQSYNNDSLYTGEDVAIMESVSGQVAIAIERRQSEEELARSEKNYRYLVENSPLGILTMNKEGVIIKVNSRLLEMLGSPSEEYTKSVNLLTSPNIVKAGIARDFRVCLETGESIISEKPYLTNFNKYLYLKIYLVPMRDSENNVMGVQALLEDVTRQKIAEKALRDSEEKYRLLVNNANEAIFVTQDFKLKYVNPTFLKITGYDEDDIYSMDMFDIVHPDDREMIRHRYRERILGKLVDKHSSFILVTKNGKKKWIDMAVVTVNWDGEKALLAFITDNTERNLAELALRENEQKYRTIFENIQDVYYESTVDGKMLLVSPSAEKISRYTVNELMNLSIYDLYADKSQRDELLKTLKVTMYIKDYEILLKDKNREERYCSVTAGLFPDNEGKLFIIKGTLRDIHDRKLMEIALKESDETARALMNAPTDSVILFDQNGKYLEVNDTVATYYDLPKDKIIGKYLNDFMPQKIAGYRMDMIRKVIESRGPVRFEDIRFDNWFDNVFYPVFDIDGNVNKVAVIARNITNLKEAEQSLKKANASKDKFFSIIAHDLRSPLSGFISLSNMLLQNYDSMESNEMKEISQALNDSATRLNKLLENLLKWASIQRGNVEFKPEWFNINEIIIINVGLMKLNIDNKNLKVINNVDNDIKVFADMKMIGTVIRNLLSNAIKFSFDNGRIEFNCDLTDNNMAYVSVSDNGIGISDKNLSRIFKPDQNFSSLGTHKEKGTGLGLILCKELINKNGGKISVKSRQGEGTTFTFTLKTEKK